MMALQPFVAFADKWKFEDVKKESKYKFGDVVITRIVDARQDQYSPDHIIKIERKSNLAALYRNVSFQEIFASKDNKTFVGLSNGGIPGTAIVIFNNKGELKIEIKHDFGNFDYCKKSVTLIREWYEGKNSKFEFLYDKNNNITDMRLLTCKGKTVSLYDVIERAYNKRLWRQPPPQ